MLQATAGAGGAGGGGNDVNTVLLIHSDTFDGDINFTDSSIGGSTHTLNENAEAQHSTNEQHFGATSIWLEAIEESFVDASTSADFNFGASDEFTVDFWFWSDSGSSGFNQIIDFRDSSGTIIGWVAGIETNGYPYFYLQDNGAQPDFSVEYQIDHRDDSWHHFAAVIEADHTVSLYIDGVLRDTADKGTNDYDGSAILRIGCDFSEANFYDGYLDEIRISNTARWTEGFDVPTGPYTE